MKRTIILAAFAATASIALVGGAGAASSFQLSTEEFKTCLVLELAHETTCAEYEAKLMREYAAAQASTNDDDVTGGIARAVATSMNI
jgi:hypothetical protein